MRKICVIFISSFLNRRFLSLNYQHYKICVDVTKQCFFKNIIFLYQHLLYPLYLAGKSYHIDCPFPSIKAISISPLFLHTNLEAIQMHLYLEAWYNLSKKEKLIPISNPFLLDMLNPEQKRAVRKIFGPICLLAPAGSGKTKTLVNRILYLLNCGISISSILILVFNKKAEMEIKERLSSKVENLQVYTFHSFCYQILREYSEYEFYSEDPNEFCDVLLERAISKYYPLIYKKNHDPFIKYREMLSKVKNQLLQQNEMIMDIDYEKRDFYPIFQEYLRLLEEEKLCDFDDMLYLTLCLLLQNGELRNKIQKRFQFLLIDEFQDLNPVQLLLMQLLALPQNHLFVVGDDDQMIYGFRGASVDGILNFQTLYPSACRLQLKTNYRSKKRIVFHAKQLINHNLNRVSKEITSFSLEDGSIDVLFGKNLLEECEHLVSWLLKQNPKNSIAILYRYQEHGEFLKLYLNLIEFWKEEENVSLFQSFLFCLELLLLEKNFCQFEKQWKEKFDKLGNAFIIYQKFQKEDLPFPSFFLQLGFSPSFFFTKKVSDSLLLSFLSSFGTVKQFYKYYQERKINCSNFSFLLSTIHKTKGNEFESVCYFHLETPVDKEILEEERRIVYVALTRAKTNLLITCHPTERTGFLKEYLQNPEFEFISSSQLLENYHELLDKYHFYYHKHQLLKKDYNMIHQHCSYEINEKMVSYVKNEKNIIQSYQTTLNLLEEKLFSLREEIRTRDLFLFLSCGIIESNLEEGNYEKIISRS